MAIVLDESGGNASIVKQPESLRRFIINQKLPRYN